MNLNWIDQGNYLIPMTEDFVYEDDPRLQKQPYVAMDKLQDYVPIIDWVCCERADGTRRPLGLLVRSGDSLKLLEVRKRPRRFQWTRDPVPKPTMVYALEAARKNEEFRAAIMPSTEVRLLAHRDIAVGEPLWIDYDRTTAGP